jgi:lipid II:glycine glycyltransferase (peptidoglycan interpeptide bridge formation enzyme)
VTAKIYTDKDLPRSDWEELTNGSFFSSPQFASIWRAKGGRPMFYVDEERGKLRAGIAGVVFGQGMWHRYESMPSGLYGGPFFSKDFSMSDKGSFIDSFCQYVNSLRPLRVHIYKPATDINNTLLTPCKASTHIIQLTDDYEQPEKKIIKHIRAAKKRGGMIEQINSGDDITGFYRLFKATYKRHRQRIVLPISLFQRLFDIARDDKRIVWLKVTYENKMIASRLAFIDNTELFSWQFVHDKEYSRLKPGYLLLDYMIQFAREQGLKSLNLGGSPEDAGSLQEYKERWGGVKREYRYYSYYSRLGKLLYRRRKR